MNNLSMATVHANAEKAETLDEYAEHNKPWLDKAIKQAENGEFHILTEEELSAF
jgi:hypothetical protein